MASIRTKFTPVWKKTFEHEKPDMTLLIQNSLLGDDVIVTY